MFLPILHDLLLWYAHEFTPELCRLQRRKFGAVNESKRRHFVRLLYLLSQNRPKEESIGIISFYRSRSEMDYNP